MSKRDTIRDLAEEVPPNAGGWVRLPCPWCEDLGHYSTVKNLAVNMESGYYKCWRAFHCRTEGWLYGAEDRVYSSAYTHLASIKAVPLVQQLADPTPNDVEGFTRVVGRDGASKAIAFPYLRYLKQRRVSAETMVECGIGYTTQGKYAGRVVVPLTSFEGVTGYFGSVTRRIDWKHYKNTDGLCRDAMFNERALWEDSPDPIGIVEGVFDALPHYPYAVGCLGAPSDTQIEILMRSKRPLVFVLDPDAKLGALQLINRFALRGRDVRVAHLPPGQDPGTTSVTDFINLIFQDTP